MLQFVLFFISLFFGLITFPILFYFQKLLKLPIPDMEKEKIHIHHSLYGLFIVVLGKVLVLTGIRLVGLSLVSFGSGLIIHHEISEPLLKGIGKFVYFNSKLRE